MSSRNVHLPKSHLCSFFLIGHICTFDTTQCQSEEKTCGNGRIDPGEQCDGTDLGGKGCPDLEFAGGTLACRDECTFDTASCTSSKCGNGVREPGETCDGDCPTECDDDGDACTQDALIGSQQNCDAACNHSPILQCGADDGCCPVGCGVGSDGDCPICVSATPPEGVKVNLPADEGAHSEALEWWYWTGHLETVEGRWFGFEVVFFLGQQLGIWGQIDHVAITDVTGGTFHHDSSFLIGRPEDVPGGYKFDVGGVSAEGAQGRDVLHGEVDGYVLDLVLLSNKSPVYQHGVGYTDYPGVGGYTYYYSRENIEAQGTLVVDGLSLPVKGKAWFDHQWGSLVEAQQVGWDWYALQLDDNREVMIFLLRESDVPVLVGGSLTDAACNTVALKPEEIQITPRGEWVSPHTGCTYPQGWDVRVRELNLVVTPVLADQEIQAQYPVTNYYEGACTVSGDASGRAYVELTQYCK